MCVCVFTHTHTQTHTHTLPLGSLGDIIEIVHASAFLINSSAPMLRQFLSRRKFPPYPVHAWVYDIIMWKELRCACSHP